MIDWKSTTDIIGPLLQQFSIISGFLGHLICVRTTKLNDYLMVISITPFIHLLFFLLFSFLSKSVLKVFFLLFIVFGVTFMSCLVSLIFLTGRRRVDE